MAKLADHIIKDLSASAGALTAELRSLAFESGWPRHIVPLLTVSVLNKQLVINYPDTYSDEINDLEYGTADVAPAPVFRTFLNKRGEPIKDAVASGSLNYLFEKGVLP